MPSCVDELGTFRQDFCSNISDPWLLTTNTGTISISEQTMVVASAFQMNKEKSHPRARLIQLLKDAASKAIAEGDPWAKYHMEKVPAERIIRHLYHPTTRTWTTDETIVKMEREPFTHGAMRFCYRMKKRSPPPMSASNHRFHNHGWTRASNYVAKAYQKDGVIDTSDEAKAAVQNDVTIQYEASHWAESFNEKEPPKKIVFIRAYAIELPDRPGSPWFAVERYITGKDSYGCGFTKHNTNSGFVDEDLHRVTPQVFSAHSFYASEGERLVADIQGVGDLYTDPQVLSSDYRFGDGDLGPRGMALFFKTFRHNSVAESMGIPVFPLSKNELKHQAKFEDDVWSLSEASSKDMRGMDMFAFLDLNRNRRTSVFQSPLDLQNDELKATARRSNLTSRDDIRKSLRFTAKIHKPSLHRSKSDIDEVQQCLILARTEFHFGLSTHLHKKAVAPSNSDRTRRSSLLVRKVSAPMVLTETTRINLGRVHYQLAVLHGMDRFPEVVQVVDDTDLEDVPSHDAFSVLFHLSHAASLRNVPACLALARLHAGLGSGVSYLLENVVPVDFDAAKELFRYAMESSLPPAAPKAAAGCLLYQILQDEENVDNSVLMSVLADTISLLEAADAEKLEVSKHKESMASRGPGFCVGDLVEGNYFLEGVYYPGVIEEVSDDGTSVVIKYDDDGSTETLAIEHVRRNIPPTATQTNLGGPLSDEEAFGAGNSDEKCLMNAYELKAELGELKEKAGDLKAASALFDDAASGAMEAGKMKTASEWSMKAAELLP